MNKFFDPRKPATAFDHTITLVIVLELSGKSWELGASVPGVSRRPLRRISVGDVAGILKTIEQWKAEAGKGGHRVSRVVLGYEAGRDGFWIARALQERGIEVYVMHAAGIAVERRGRRAKTDRIDIDMLLGTLLGWLRGEPRQLKDIETARQQVVAVVDPDRIEKMIQLPAHIVGLGVATATTLVHEVLSRKFRDRRAIAAFVGLTGTPFNSGGSTREQGISQNGNPRVRRIVTPLMWRWIKLQPESGLTKWFLARTGGAKGRIKKIMAVALARKLLVALWRHVETGVIPDGARLAAA